LKSSDELKKIAISTLLLEAEAVKKLADFIGDDFVASVNHIIGSKGRVVVTGIGKSAIIASKIVATLNSTGTPAVFMHAADAIHGDLGTIQIDDTIICISKSGNTAEIKALVPLLKKGGNILIALVGNLDSYLAKQAHFILDTTVEREACPNNLAPTSSTTAQLAMGDALAVCLLQCRDFSGADFAKFHPGGSLGKKLYLKVSDISVQNQHPQVGPEDDIRTVILEISSKCLGATAVIEAGKLIGVITDGDLRRMLEKSIHIEGLRARDIMSKNPKHIEGAELAVVAVQLMEDHKITQLIVTEQGRYAGFVHMHDLLREGLL
jgi:arabinose-5-phosphate isomerase